MSRGSKMRRFSHILSSLTVALFLLLTGSVAAADTAADPKIGLSPTGSTATCTQTVGQPSISPCSFTTDANGHAVDDITNDTGLFLIQDTVTMLGAAIANLNCSVGPDAPNWTTSDGTTGPTPAVGNACAFFGGFISPGHLYGLNFDGFAANTTYLFDLTDVRVADLPEPGTMILLGVGLAAVAASRKRLKGARITSSSAVC